MLLKHYHTLPVIQFCRIIAREETIFVKIFDIFEFFAFWWSKLSNLANLWFYKLIMT